MVATRRSSINVVKTIPFGEELCELWSRASEYDPTIRITSRQWPSLLRRRIRPQRYTRELLFSGMAAGRTSLFNNYPVEVLTSPGGNVHDTLVRALTRHFPRGELARVRSGQSGRLLHLTARELMKRWASKHSRVCVTDLHVRGSILERVIDLSHLSEFNILYSRGDDISYQEIMTMVISSQGAVTDSHSDDPDGSNHCFEGLKLWLMWDTFEGRRRGLQDTERDTVRTRPTFDMRTFLSLRTAQWLCVGRGDTLFLPGHLTHKVITLEPYLGVGSFYVSLPNVVRTIARWLKYGPLWSLEDDDGENTELVAAIAQAAAAKVSKLEEAPLRSQLRWGYDFARRGMRSWQRTELRTHRHRLARKQELQEVLSAIARIGDRSRRSHIPPAARKCGGSAEATARSQT